MPNYDNWQLAQAEAVNGYDNPDFLVFNDSIIGESSGSPRWSNVRIANENSEVRRKFRSRPLWQLDLSNLLLSEKQYEELLAFQWVNEGMAKEFLCRNARQYLFEDSNGNPSLIGTVSGDPNQEFQLRKERKIQSRTTYETIRYPKWYYKPLLDINGRPWLVMPDTEIWVGGDGTVSNKGQLVSGSSLFEMDRNSGKFALGQEFPNGRNVYAYGGYFTLMICTEDDIPVKLKGSQFQISNGVKFTEPITREDDDEDEGGLS